MDFYGLNDVLKFGNSWERFRTLIISIWRHKIDLGKIGIQKGRDFEQKIRVGLKQCSARVLARFLVAPKVAPNAVIVFPLCFVYCLELGLRY